MTILNVLQLLLLAVIGLVIGSGYFQPIKIASQRKNPTGLEPVFFNSPKWLHFGTAVTLLVLMFMTQWPELIACTLGYNAGLAWWQVSVANLFRRN